MSGKLQPPVNAGITGTGGNLSQSWAQYHQRQADALNAAIPQVGDYRVSLSPNLGNTWLLCNGGDASNANYPALYALLHPILGDGGAPGTFKLPTIPDTTSSGHVVGHTYIKAA